MNVVYVIIVTYNGMQWIDKCLKSVFSSTVPAEVIIIDNLSTDGTVAFVKENYPVVNLIETGQNIGFGKANNIGLIEAINNKADYVFLLNQDAYLQADTLEGLMEVHRKNKSYGIISPMHLNGSGTSLDYNFSGGCNVVDCPGLLPDLYLRQTKDIYKATSVNAALWLIPLKCILEVGVFDPFFPHYGEDVDYVNRIKYFGYHVGISPDFAGYHDREQRPYSAKRNNSMLKTTYLYMLKDINKKFVKAILASFLLLFKYTLKDIVELKFKSLIEDFKTFIYLIYYLLKIYRDRQLVKKGGAFINAVSKNS